MLSLATCEMIVNDDLHVVGVCDRVARRIVAAWHLGVNVDGLAVTLVLEQ